MKSCAHTLIIRDARSAGASPPGLLRRWVRSTCCSVTHVGFVLLNCTQQSSNHECPLFFMTCNGSAVAVSGLGITDVLNVVTESNEQRGAVQEEAPEAGSG